MKLPNTASSLERTQELAPLNEVRSLGPQFHLMSIEHVLPRAGYTQTLEWYFECAYYGIETLREFVDIDSTRRGGVPVLRGTRVTIADALAEIADSTGVTEVADNFDLRV